MRAPDDFPDDHRTFDAHPQDVAGDPSGKDHSTLDTPTSHVPASSSPAEAIGPSKPNPTTSRLEDALLLIYADALDDFERTRIATENRVRSLQQVKGLAGSPEEQRLQATVDALKALEHGVELELKRAMREHPLGGWIKATTGIGHKQGGRLIAAIGDPYWHSRDNRPRTVSELWALCGYHVLHPSQRGHVSHGVSAGVDLLGPDQTPDDPQLNVVGSDPSSDPGQRHNDLQFGTVGVAPKRRKGQKANWNGTAKMRAHLVAESCMKCEGKTTVITKGPRAGTKVVRKQSPYRDVYDARRSRTAVTHPEWTDGHSDNDALRVTAKAILKDLWRESKRLHEEGNNDTPA